MKTQSMSIAGGLPILRVALALLAAVAAEIFASGIVVLLPGPG